MLFEAEKVLGDGTFKSAPQLWAQVFTLHVMVEGYYYYYYYYY
jgi:hypothetical protein